MATKIAAPGQVSPAGAGEPGALSAQAEIKTLERSVSKVFILIFINRFFALLVKVLYSFEIYENYPRAGVLLRPWPRKVTGC
jgi:hypothetical protein